MRTAIQSALSVLLVGGALAAACTEGSMSRASEKQGDAPSLEALQWTSPAEGARYQAVRAAIVADAKGWTALPLARGGAFVRERWCAPDSAADACARGQLRQTLPWGAQWAILSTHAYGNRYPQVFGLGLERGALLGDWGLVLTVSRGGRDVTGDHVQLQFVQPEVDHGVVRLALGDEETWPVVDQTFRVSAGAEAVVGLLGALRASPDSFRDAALGRIDALATEVRRGIAAHEAYRCVYDKRPAGTSTPPPCTPVPLSADDEQAALAAAERVFAERRALVETHAAALHALVVALVPAALTQP